MLEWVEAVILGIVQGLTEFLPVSSSGHLELVKWLIGDTNTAAESFLMTVVLHFGTALATVWVFRKFIFDVLRTITLPAGRSYLLWIIISLIPAAAVGLGLEKQIEALFDRQIILVASMLLLTGIVLIWSDRATRTTNPLTGMRAWWIGVAQAIAILPGISRSGATITTGVALGIDRKEVARFSFLMVLPLIFAKIGKDALDGNLVSHSGKMAPLAIGFIVSFFVGVAACRLMIRIVEKARLRYFGYYCLAVGIMAIILRLTLLK